MNVLLTIREIVREWLTCVCMNVQLAFLARFAKCPWWSHQPWTMFTSTRQALHEIGPFSINACAHRQTLSFLQICPFPVHSRTFLKYQCGFLWANVFVDRISHKIIRQPVTICTEPARVECLLPSNFLVKMDFFSCMSRTDCVSFIVPTNHSIVELSRNFWILIFSSNDDFWHVSMVASC